MTLPMRLTRPAAMMLLVLQQPGRSPVEPGTLVRATLAAVEGDSTTAFRARWSRALRRDSTDRSALLSLGSLARLTYDYGRADSILARVVALNDADALADYARIELGASHAARGRFREAADAYAIALSGAERRGDSTAIGDALLGLAVPRSRLAAPADVLPLLDRAERLARGDARMTANARCQRAVLLSRLGRPEAMGLAESGVELARRAGDRRQEARCMWAAAQDFAARGDMDRAAEALGRARPLYERSGDRASLAGLLQWRGFLLNTLGRYGEAQVALTAAVAEGERAHAMSPVGWALINLGTISLGLGDNITASRDLTRAVALLDSQGDQWGAVTARSMLGGVARATGDTAAARAIYQRVLDWAERSGDAQTQRRMHGALAEIAEMGRDWPLAAREYQIVRAIAVAHNMRGYQDGLFFNTGRLALRSGDLPRAERDLRAAVGVVDTAQHSYRYTARALLAEALLARGNVAGAEAELLAATGELDRWRASLSDHDQRVRAMEFVYGLDPDLGVATVIAGLAAAGRVETAFRLSERRRARDLVDRIQRAAATRDGVAPARQAPHPESADLANLLPDDSSALLEYVTGRGGEPTTLFVLTRAGMTARLLAPIDSLAGDLRRFLTLLESDGDARPLGVRLGEALLGPALGELGPGISRLIIVPDDILARVPFDALILGDGRYLLERFTVSLVPSAGVLAAVRARPAPARPLRLVAFGDPSFAPRPNGASASEPATVVYRAAFDSLGGLPRLAGSAREVRNVARYAPGAVVRVRGGASEAWLRAAPLDSFRILHFATHALVDDEATSRTALALAPGEGQDGFLGPGDLAALRLDADLVVLSACRTAGGVVLRGEGVQGLTAPLLQAGARSVVATTWRIADASAERVVGALYRALASGKTVSDGLREAKLEALRAGARPSEWAAYVSLGDPMTRIPLTEPGRPLIPEGWPWIAVGLALLVGSVGYGVTRMRRDAAAA